MEKVTVHRIDLLDLTQGEIAGINHVIENAKSATVFHTIEWNRLLIEHFRPSYIALLASSGQSVVGLHILYLSNGSLYQSPAINLHSVYGGPIALEDDSQIPLHLIRESERIRPLSYFQIWTPPGMSKAPFLQLGYLAEELHTPVMRLDCSQEERWASLHKDKRYKIRKAQNAGVYVEEAGAEDLEMYSRMAADTLTRGGVAPLPLGFLERVIEILAPMNMARLFLAKLGQEVISGTIILYHKKTAYGWDIGWRREFANISPNDILTWEISESARMQGYKFFDLLRIEPDRLPGIAKWKATFGGDIETCYLLRKATMSYRLLHPIRVLFSEPGRAIRKISSIFVK